MVFIFNTNSGVIHRMVNGHNGQWSAQVTMDFVWWVTGLHFVLHSAPFPLLCPSHAPPMPLPCPSHAPPMPLPCPSHAPPMPVYYLSYHMLRWSNWIPKIWTEWRHSWYLNSEPKPPSENQRAPSLFFRVYRRTPSRPLSGAHCRPLVHTADPCLVDTADPWWTRRGTLMWLIFSGRRIRVEISWGFTEAKCYNLMSVRLSYSPPLPGPLSLSGRMRTPARLPTDVLAVGPVRARPRMPGEWILDEVNVRRGLVPRNWGP